MRHWSTQSSPSCWAARVLSTNTLKWVKDRHLSGPSQSQNLPHSEDSEHGGEFASGVFFWGNFLINLSDALNQPGRQQGLPPIRTVESTAPGSYTHSRISYQLQKNGRALTYRLQIAVCKKTPTVIGFTGFSRGIKSITLFVPQLRPWMSFRRIQLHSKLH